MDREMVQLLNYCATHPYTVIWYKKSDIILAIHSDASYLSDPKSHIQSGRHFLLMKKSKLGQPMKKNVAVHVVSTIIHNAMPSAAEANISALYLNEKYGVIIQNTLEQMGHLHP